MPSKKPLMISAVVVTTLIVAAYLVLLSLDFNRYKPRIVQAVQASSGLDVAIHGDIEIGFGLDLRVVIHDIDVRNVSWGSRPEMIRIKRCEVNLALLRLIRGALEIDQVFFIEPDFFLETNPSGQLNFRVSPSKEPSPRSRASRSPDLVFLPVREVQVEKGRFAYRDGKTGETLTQDVNHLVVSASGWRSPVHLQLQGSLNDRPVRVEGTFGSLAELLDPGRSWPLDLKASLDGSIASVRGTISDLPNLRGFFLITEAQGPSISEALSLAGLETPFEPGPFRFEALINDAGAGLGLNDIDLRVGVPESREIKISGTIADLFSLKGVDLQCRAQFRDLSNLAGPSGTSSPVKGPVALSGRIADSAPEILRFAPLHLSFGKQEFTGSAQLDTTGKLPRLNVELASSELDLGKVLASLDEDSTWAAALRRMGLFSLRLSVVDPSGQPSLEGLDLRVGTAETAELKVTGSVKDPIALQGMHLICELRGNNASALENILGKPVPVRGPFAASGRFADGLHGALTVDPVEVSLGLNKVSGMIELIPEEGKPRLKAQVSSQKLDLEPVLKPGIAGASLLRALSALRPITAAFTLSDPAGNPAVEEASAVLGTVDLAKVTVEGSIRDLFAVEGIDLRVAAEGKDAARLSGTFGEPSPLRGPFSLKARARDPEAGVYRLEDLTAALGENEILGWIESRVSPGPLSLEAELSSNRIDLGIVDSVKTLHAEALRDIGPWSLKTQTLAHADRVSVEKVQLVIGTRDRLEARVAGVIHDLFAWHGVDLKCSLQGEDPASLVAFTGIPLPWTGGFDVSGRLIDPKAGIYKVKNFEARFGENDLAGSFDLDMTDNKPRLTADVSSSKLDLRPSRSEPQKAERVDAETRTPRAKVFPADPLPFERLMAMDGKLRMRAGQILLPRSALGEVSAEIALQDGHLQMHPFQCRIGGGKVEGRLDLRAARRDPAAALDLKAEGIDIGKMLEELEVKKSLEGTLGAEISVQSRGPSVAALMAGMNGRVVAVEREGRIYNRYLDVLGGGLLRETVSLVYPFREEEEFSELSCGVQVFDIENGLATCRTWLADTRYTLLSGRGEVDLKDEKLDLLFALTPKKGLGIGGVEVGVSLPGVARSFKLGGTLARPSIKVNPRGAAGTLGKMVGGFTLLGPLGLAAGILDLRVGDKDPCLETLKALENGTYSTEAPETDSTPSPSPDDDLQDGP